MVLELNNITKYFEYDNNKQVLFENLTIRFPNCGLFVIKGDSGCGKSTLLNIINNTQEVNEGIVLYNDNDINCIDDYKQKIVSNVYQNSCLINCLTIKENLELFCKIKDISIDCSLLIKYLKILKIKELLNKYPNECSGGQIQRVGIVRALICNTPILTCDEPTASLDDHSKELVIKLLKEYSKTHLVILVTHDCDFTKKSDIDFNNLKSKYIFNNKGKQNTNIINEVHKLDYSKKRLIYDKYKVLLMMVSQIITIITCSILISGINGTMNYYNDLINNSLLSNQLIISNKNNTLFTDKSREYLANDYENMFYLDMNVGTVNNNSDFRSYIVFNDLKENEVIVNESFIKKYKVKNKSFVYKIDNREITLKIKSIHNNDFLYQPSIYFSNNTFNNDIKHLLIDKTQVVIKVDKNNIDQIIDKYETNYFVYNEIIDWKDNIQSLYSLAFIVFILFISISIFIAVILYYLVFLSILLERKKDYALLICNGFKLNKLKNMIINESTLIIIMICFIGGLLSHFLIYFFNHYKVLESITSFKLVFKEPNIIFSNYCLYLVIFFIYGLLSYFISLKVYKQVKMLDFVSTLKEEE